MIKRTAFLGRAHDVWSYYERSEGGYGYGNLWAASCVLAPKQASPDNYIDRLALVPLVLSGSSLSTWASMVGDCADLLNQESGLGPEQRYAILKDVMPTIQPYLDTYFGCDSMALFVRFFNNLPDDDKPYAAGWHCDAGPRKHLKLLLYLNHSAESGGNTEFLSYSETMQFDEAGYLFCDLNQRLEDLGELASLYGINYRPIDWHITAGSGILFEPACIMHRARWPTKGPRRLVQICFIPSPIGWERAFEQFGLPTYNNAWRSIKVN